MEHEKQCYMNDDTLNKLHLALLYITDEVDRICRKYNITYSLTGGSMIGAVRHKGFIPWDDDMDIAMLRSEYERFVEACKEDLSQEFELQTMESDPNYFYSFGKLVLKGTALLQAGHEKTNYRKGIFIDIFPLDNVPEDIRKWRKQGEKNYLNIKLIQGKGKYYPQGINSTGKKIIYSLLKISSSFFSFDFLKRRLISNIIKYDCLPSEKVCNFGGYYGYQKETTLKKYFNKIIYVPFEDRQYPISYYYDDYLTSIYGDYMKLPPVEKRHTHDFLQLDFGDYSFIKKEEE